MIEPLVERVCARGVDVANFLDKRCVVEGHYAVLADWALMQNVVTAFVPARKLRKLQRSTVQELFALEYGGEFDCPLLNW